MNMELSRSQLLPWAMSGSGYPTVARQSVLISMVQVTTTKDSTEDLALGLTLEAILVSKDHAAIEAM